MQKLKKVKNLSSEVNIFWPVIQSWELLLLQVTQKSKKIAKYDPPLLNSILNCQ